MGRNDSCKERVAGALESVANDLSKLWEAYKDGEEEVEDLGTFGEYGLAFDYVAAGTFSDQKVGYFRYQICYGGPTEEFRFYTDAEYNVGTIEFWLLDWFDGASIDLTGSDFNLLEEIFEDFKGCGCVQAEYEKAAGE